MIIGVDIGGTNTDAVLVDGNHIVKSVKVTTDETSFFKVIEALKHPNLKAIKLGTTAALNALLEKKGLYQVGVIRLAGHHPLMLNPLAPSLTIGGGFEFDGRPITPFSLQELDNGVEKLLENGMESLAIVGAFASVYPLQELQALQHLKTKYDLPITLSHQIGGIGFLERENAAILNAALKKPIIETFSKLTQNLKCPLILTQNNGCMLSYEEALEKPILTLSSGPTNSFVGAAKLAGLDHAIIVDIGGTSTDIGVVKNGVPRKTFATSRIGNAALQFPMPDVVSLAIGGGSHISLSPLTIGPQSVAKHLLKEALSFGGSKLTLTDIALHQGHFKIPAAKNLDLYNTEDVFPHIIKQIEKTIQKFQVKEYPIVLVGGGASLIPKKHLSSRYIFPKHHEVANAYGAAFAEQSYIIDRVQSLEGRDEVIEQLKKELFSHLVDMQCRDLKIDHFEVTPYSYLPGNLARYYLSGRGVSPL